MSATCLHKRDAVKRRRAIGRAAICLLLAALFLYNPFLNMAASANGLAVAHRDSNRSTVGSGEFQHFTPTDSQDSAVPEISVPLFFHLDAPVSIVSYVPRFEVPLIVQRILLAELWFRPPPAVR
jgi:hypothetical protein